MKLLWTRSSSPLSKVIRWITGQDCSHFSFVFEGPGRSGLMFESNLLGTHPAFFQTSLNTHTIIHELDIQTSIEIEDMIWDLCVYKYDGKGYDFGGALYIAWRYLLYRVIKKPIPTINKWASPGLFYCEEIIEILKQIPNMIKIETNSMATPHDLWLKLGGFK